METESEIRHGRHCVSKMHVHLVFLAKYRRRVFDRAAVEALRGIEPPRRRAIHLQQ